MDDEKRWQDMNADEQAKRITELAGALNHLLHRIEALEAKIKARERQEQEKELFTDTGSIG